MEYKIQGKTCKRCCGAGIKSRGAELNFIPEPKLRTEAPAPAPLYLLQSSYRYILKEIFRISCPLDLLSEGRAAPAVCWGGMQPPPSPVWTWGGENLLYLSPPVKGTVQ
jgi:hypothetical protein